MKTVQEIVSEYGDPNDFEKVKLVADLAFKAGQKDMVEKYKPIFEWLQGLNGDFPDLSQKPHYSFRTELRKRLADISSLEELKS